MHSPERNVIDAAFSRGDVPRHQVHRDKRLDRRVKHKQRPFVDGEE